ncbi:MAG: hypothetical protein V4617_10270 [Gemmatimonadota bacterium]
MRVVPCEAPIGQLDPAPLTSLPLELSGAAGSATAFWNSADEYFLCLSATGFSCDGDEAAVAGTEWFRIADEAGASLLAPVIDQESRETAARQFLEVIPMGGGRVAFPVGSTGRTVYRVWRSKGGSANGNANADRPTRRTRILGVRAGRSLRRPA